MSSKEAINDYISEHKLDRLIKDLTTCVLVHKPSNPHTFMIDALQALSDQDEKDVDFYDFFSEYASKQPKKKSRGISFNEPTPAPTPALPPANPRDRRRIAFPEPTEEKAKEAGGGLAPPGLAPPGLAPPGGAGDSSLPNFNRRRRKSVSAESLKPTDEENTERVVIPKSDQQRMRIFSAIANNLLFRNLESDQRQEVMDAMFEKRVPEGEVVIQQGDQGDNFYVVDDGIFDIYVNDRKVVEVKEGGSFGELALMYNTPRAATVKAQIDSVLWGVDRVTFRRIIMNNTFRKRKMYENFVRTVPILQSLEPEERVKVADALEPQTYSDGDAIIEEGDPGDCFYIIVSGEVVVTKKMKKKREEGEEGDSDEEEDVEVNRLQKGQYFGELALLTDKPRAATVTAVNDVECVALDTRAFIRLLGPVTEILKRNADTYAKYSNVIPLSPRPSDD